MIRDRIRKYFSQALAAYEKHVVIPHDRNYGGRSMSGMFTGGDNIAEILLLGPHQFNDIALEKEIEVINRSNTWEAIDDKLGDHKYIYEVNPAFGGGGFRYFMASNKPPRIVRVEWKK